jgi:hypothetical protein
MNLAGFLIDAPPVLIFLDHPIKLAGLSIKQQSWRDAAASFAANAWDCR